MGKSDVWAGEHSEQLNEILGTIIKSEKASKGKISLLDEVNIRDEISEAYTEIVRCFEKENADPSIITYAVNLMKSNVSNEKDLKNITKLAISVSQSKIGALYLVSTLEEQNKGIELGLSDSYEMSEGEQQANIEELTKKIDASLDQDVIDALCSEENETEYEKLLRKANLGDKDAQSAMVIIKKAVSYMHIKPQGKGRDLAALSLLDRLISTNEKVAITTAEQLVKVYELEKYDIFDEREDGDKTINLEKVRNAFEKHSKEINVKSEQLTPEEYRQFTLNSFDLELYKNQYGDFHSMIKSVKRDVEFDKFLEHAKKLQNTDETNLLNLFKNNPEQISSRNINMVLQFANTADNEYVKKEKLALATQMTNFKRVNQMRKDSLEPSEITVNSNKFDYKDYIGKYSNFDDYNNIIPKSSDTPENRDDSDGR